ncbi:DUF6950 family protein [Polaromonas jejuensis]|uniref:DUF6950 family protein n=1 Tax=Polaromonas jejuensis TaxID=457502 RepID=A0ABW0QGH2_9BURK|nr:hypothetical protein [Polaromonas jejuensis]
MTTCPRHPNWQALLDDYVRANERKPFAWSGQNCSTFATEWVRIATGRVLAVPDTLTAREALRTVRGLRGLYADACTQLGEPVPGLMARSGDFVLLRLPRSRGRVVRVFGVCLGSVVAGQGTNGLVMVPITEAEAAWRI